ncbi:MAG: OsmC family protein [Actinomycetota bacterium]|nr:OsmC family protein [Actinomycetota bacterium]
MDAWTKDPEKALGAPTVTARADESQATIQAGPFTWRADLPPALGGTNEAPSPTALLLGALAGCAVVFVRDTLAPQLGVRVDAVEATVGCQTDGRGLLGIDGAQPDLRKVTLDVSIQSPDGDTGVNKIAEVWQQRCPIYLALVKPTDVAVQFRTG